MPEWREGALGTKQESQMPNYGFGTFVRLSNSYLEQLLSISFKKKKKKKQQHYRKEERREIGRGQTRGMRLYYRIYNVSHVCIGEYMCYFVKHVRCNFRVTNVEW